MHPMPDAATELIPLVTDPPPRRRRFVRWLVAGLVVAALAAGAAVVVTRHRAAGAPRPEQPGAVATAKIERRDLSTTTSLPGSIGYGAPRPLAAHKEATVTWLPPAGATIKRGGQLLRADDRPVTLFYGSMPLYRAIAGGNMVGRDVQIIARNLAALGYSIGRQPAEGERVVQSTPPAGPKTADPKTADPKTTDPKPAAGKTTSVRVKEGEGVLTARLIKAIKSWQNDTGQPVTGTVTLGDVEVLSGAIRVEAVTVQPGSPANAVLMSVTPTRKVVTVAAELSDAGSIQRGDKVTVVLPDERTAKARVVSVGRDLATAEGSGADGAPTLTVTVTVDDPKSIAGLDSADVKVNFAGRSVRDVLAAPVEALVALTEGGYALQGPAGLVAVRTGMFADGWVEVTGEGLTEGTDVVVSS
ncbi:hypothetical protein [Actinoplanes sp. ATCC 53533]|uniref:hypothetical protein n=1 Tax=Actinoplanes sp. ATCC 53533 TaxID=1288362 RepID=UPI00131503D1|nr:hypothetical protein [Actinoplanes sp. ATCC 53533]